MQGVTQVTISPSAIRSREWKILSLGSLNGERASTGHCGNPQLSGKPRNIAVP
jgi:hypothetical protein